jgi:ketosteroid isomerase-like protein
MSFAPPTPEACLAEFEAALVRADLDGAMALLSDDAIFFYSNASAHFGKDAIRTAIKANFDSIKDDNYATHDKIWLVHAVDAAACVCSFAWEGTMDGKKVGGRGRGTTVLLREPAGWRIVHEHLSQGRWRPKTP